MLRTTLSSLSSGVWDKTSVLRQLTLSKSTVYLSNQDFPLSCRNIYLESIYERDGLSNLGGGVGILINSALCVICVNYFYLFSSNSICRFAASPLRSFYSMCTCEGDVAILRGIIVTLNKFIAYVIFHSLRRRDVPQVNI